MRCTRTRSTRPCVPAAGYLSANLSRKLCCNSMVGLFWFNLVSGNFKQARERATLCLSAAEEKGDSGLAMQAHYMLAHLVFHLGEHMECDRQLAAGLALYDAQKHARQVEVFGIDVRVNGLALRGLNLWVLGFADQARAMLREAVNIARTVPHPVPLTLALVLQTFRAV